jgi:uncharacterized protein YqhQ
MIDMLTLYSLLSKHLTFSIRIYNRERKRNTDCLFKQSDDFTFIIFNFEEILSIMFTIQLMVAFSTFFEETYAKVKSYFHTVGSGRIIQD